MPPQPLIPSSFLPHLPRSQSSFDPVSTTDLLAHIGVLRGLYIPPVHGGFEVSDCLLEDEDTESHGKDRITGLDGEMEGLGLNGIDIPSSSSSSSGNVSQSQERGELEESREHLDPFERDWSEKWLNGVVRRAQGWLEENDPDEHDQVAQDEWMERVLRDASAALAMMAGTSGMSLFHVFLMFQIIMMNEGRNWSTGCGRKQGNELINSYGVSDPTSPIST